MRIALWRAWSESDDRWKTVPHLGLTSIVAHARHCGHEIDATYCVTADDMLAVDADLYAISSVTAAWPETVALATALVARGKPIVIGGPHITCLPESLPEGCIGVAGEGETAFVDILVLAKLGYPIRSDVKRRTRIDLADCVHLPVYQDVGGHLMAVASRGCLYKCWFCTASRSWPGPVTRFAAEHVVSSIGDYYDTHPPNGITFQDLHFANDADYAVEVCLGLYRRGAPRKFHLSGCSFSSRLSRDRAECERLLKALKTCGLEWVGIGIESASPPLFKKLKPHLTMADNERLIEICASVGVKVQASFIVGIPGETETDLRATRDFILKHTGPYFQQAGLFMYVPYPGTPGWDELLAAGRVSADMDFGLLRNGANPALEQACYFNDAMPYSEAVAWRQKISKASRPRA